jgi:hypothetical protein
MGDRTQLHDSTTKARPVRMRRALFVSWLLLGAVACASNAPDENVAERAPGGEPVVNRPTTEPPSRRTERVPLTIAIDGPEVVAPNSEIELTLRVMRRWATSEPVELSVKLPSGVSLIEGELAATLSPTASGTRRLRLRIDRVPDQDLDVRADLAGLAYGAHARAAYRFGRPLPKLARPASTPVVIGGRTRGRAIAIPATKAHQ